MSQRRPIDSLQNSHVAAARSLLTRKGRTAASLFLVEGPHAVGAAVEAQPAAVRELFVTPLAADRELDLLRAAARAAITIRTVSERVLAALGETVTPQGVVAVMETSRASLTDVMTRDLRLGVMLERIADPGNAGTVIRTADAAGATLVATTPGSVDLWSGKCVRASAGSIVHLPVVAGVEVAAIIDGAHQVGAQVLATAGDGDCDLDQLVDAGALASPTIWAFGHEAHGVSPDLRQAADRVVRLPIYGRAESLNLAAAAAICLYASARAQRE